MELSPRVVSAIEKHFAESERQEVAQLLSEYREESNPPAGERVHLAILRLSRKDVQRVRMLVELAKLDVRDVILAESDPSRTYIIGLLRRNPGPTGGFAHLDPESVQAWKTAGAIVVGGPCLDDSDVLGVYVFTADSIDAVRALVNMDSAIQSARLYFEFHPWMGADGLQAGVPADFLDV